MLDDFKVKGKVVEIGKREFCSECGKDITNKASGIHYKQKNDGLICGDCLDLLIMTDEDLPMSYNPIKERQNKIKPRGMAVTSNPNPSNKHNWPKCLKCGEQKRMIYANNKLCASCDKVEGGQANV